MKIDFKTLTGETFSVEIDGSMKIADIKQKIVEDKPDQYGGGQTLNMICSGHDMHSWRRALDHDWKILNDDQVIRDVGIKQGEFVVLLTKKAPVAAPSLASVASAWGHLPNISQTDDLARLRISFATGENAGLINGIYALMDGWAYGGKPAWKKEDDPDKFLLCFPKVNQWFVTSASMAENGIVDGWLRSSYGGAPLPTMSSEWAVLDLDWQRQNVAITTVKGCIDCNGTGFKSKFSACTKCQTIQEAKDTLGENAMFDFLDEDCNSIVTKEEWIRAFDKVDDNQDGCISRKEWHLRAQDTIVYDAIPKRNKGSVNRREWEQAFALFDINHNKQLGRNELHSFFAGMNQQGGQLCVRWRDQQTK